MAQLVKCLLCIHKDLSSSFSTQPGVADKATGGFLRFAGQPVSLNEQVPGSRGNAIWSGMTSKGGNLCDCEIIVVYTVTTAGSAE